MVNGIRLTIMVAALSVASAGCIATEEWTQDLLGKRQAEMDNRFVKIEVSATEHGKRLDTVEVRIDKVEHRLGDLENRRGIRQTTSDRADSALVQASTQRTVAQVVMVPFKFDRADLGPSAEAALTTIASQIRDNPDATLDLEGTTDSVGPYDYNVRLSARRVEAVKRRLVENGIEPARITWKARGPVLNPSIENNQKRLVIVKVIKTHN